MEIIGRGMIARSLVTYSSEFPDVVIFASGVANSQTSDPQAYEREYEMLCKEVQRCDAEQKYFVYFSSAGAVYGASDAIKDETTPTFPLSAYGKHKLLCEAVIRNSNTQHLILRLANLVGENQNPSQLIPTLRAQILADNITLYQNARRDLMDVDDFVSILLLLLKQPRKSDLFVLASGYSVAITDVFQELQQLMGITTSPKLINGGDIQQFSITKLQSAVSYTPFSKNYFRDILRKYATQQSR